MASIIIGSQPGQFHTVSPIGMRCHSIQTRNVRIILIRTTSHSAFGSDWRVWSPEVKEAGRQSAVVERIYAI